MPQQPDANDVVFDTYQIDIFGMLFGWIKDFDAAESAGEAAGFFANLWSFLVTIWDIWTILAFILSALFIFGTMYAIVRYGQLSEIHSEALLAAEKLWAELYGGVQKNNRWKDIESHISSENPNEWRIAIIEADIILEEILEKAGFPGFGVGEKLKSASPTNFNSLQDAWAAHKVRNQIAHQGADFVLTHKVARETIMQYGRVFAEFGEI